MSITKYTFFSPNGNDYPVTADADAKLYMSLSGIDYTTFNRVDWSNPTQAGLTKTFVKTSFLVAGRFFQAENQLIQLLPSASNFIHATIDLSTPLDPVKLTVESSDNSNTIDINNKSGVYKRCIEKVETNGGSIISTEKMTQNRIFDLATINKAIFKTIQTVDLKATGATNLNTLNTSGKAVLSILEVQNSTLLKNTTISGNLTVSGVTTSKFFTAGESVTTKNLTASGKTTTNSLTIKGVAGERSKTFQSPTIYSTINGTALQEFTLYRNGNVVTGNFAEIVVNGGIGGAGAIIGWIQDNDFKPEYTQKFSMRTRLGKNFMLSVDTGGAFRNWGDSIAKGDEIYGGVFWICKGTEGGLRS